MESNWVKVYTATDYVQADILQKKLEDQGIPSTVINKQDSMHVHLNGVIAIDIYVAKDNAFNAVQLLTKSEE